MTAARRGWVGGGGGISNFDPRSIAGSGVKLWLRGDQLTVVGGNVTMATDKTGNGNNVTQTGNVIPYSASAINGRPGWVGDGSGFLINDVNTLGASGAPRSFYAVAQANGGGLDGGGLIECRPNGGGLVFDWAALGAGGTGFVYFDASAVTETVAALGSPPHTAKVYSMTATIGAQIAMKVNGVAQTVAGAVTVADTGTAGFAIMSWNRRQATAGWAGAMCEFIACDSVLSAPNDAAMIAGLMAYYGIT